MSEGLTKAAERLARELLSRSLTISVAESCTGGMAAGTLTDVAGISGTFKLGIVAYSDGAKVGVLGLDGEMLAANGAVSGETAAAMAKAIRRMGATDIGVGITGIAGPSGGTPGKPVGLVFIGAATASGHLCREFRFVGSRRKIREAAVRAAMELVQEVVRQ
ncbi:MAG: nicotinamide-nucleotide amidohydrolase family protein [Candidatus Tritonobacter lacicola]|nr:nicotinamide-nucleotide amidohydrolase family protein [Candidatus Tritonobacter lacicola]